jgi:hypothetical protein
LPWRICITHRLIFQTALQLAQASLVGQAVFERLHKACGEVVWKGDTTSIIVLNQIQVDEPYEAENCHLLTKRRSNGSSKPASSEQRSLDRVKQIVAAAVVAAAKSGEPADSSPN